MMSKRKYKVGDIVNFIERQYSIVSSKKISHYGQPTYEIESLLPNGIGDFVKYKDVPQSLLK